MVFEAATKRMSTKIHQISRISKLSSNVKHSPQVWFKFSVEQCNFGGAMLRCSQQVTNFMSSLHLLAGFQRANDVQLWGLRVLTQKCSRNLKLFWRKNSKGRFARYAAQNHSRNMMKHEGHKYILKNKTTNTWMFTVFRPQFSIQLSGKFTIGDPETSLQLVWAPVACSAGRELLCVHRFVNLQPNVSRNTWRKIGKT